MREVNVLWVWAGELGRYSNVGSEFQVIRKYKRKKGYSVRPVYKNYSGYTRSGKTERFETFEEVLQYLDRNHPARRNYGPVVTPEDVLRALENAGEEVREFWKEEYEYLKNSVRRGES